MLANGSTTALSARVPLLVMLAVNAAPAIFAMRSLPSVFAHASSSTIFAGALYLPMLANAFPAAFFASVLLPHVHAIQLAPAIFAHVSDPSMIANTRTTTYFAYAVLLSMLAKRVAAAIMAMPLVSPVHTYSRPATVLARVSPSAMLAFVTLVPDSGSILLLPGRATWDAAAGACRVACVCFLFTFDGFGGTAFAFRRRWDTRDKASLVFVARCSDSTATLHMLLASETRQLAQRHVQRRFRQRAAAAAVVAELLAGRQLPQVSDDALGAQQVPTRELVQRSRRAVVAALLHETNPLVKHIALSSHASVL